MTKRLEDISPLASCQPHSLSRIPRGVDWPESIISCFVPVTVRVLLAGTQWLNDESSLGFEYISCAAGLAGLLTGC